MSVIAEVFDRKERPAFVRFERIPVEDKPASVAAGHYVAKDVDFALVTPPYSKDVFKQKVDAWFVQLENDFRAERVQREWIEHYHAVYNAWKNGQDLPLNGTAIRGWGVISPAQQETLIRMNIQTIEDLASINDEGVRRIGMGAMELKSKAIAWLSQVQDKGPLTLKCAALETEVFNLKSEIAGLKTICEGLRAQLLAAGNNPVVVPMEPQGEEITASDILPDEPEAPGPIAETIVRRGPGRPRKTA